MRRALRSAGLLGVLGLMLVGCVQAPARSEMKTAAETTTAPTTSGGNDVKTIYLAGGCFWGLEKYVDQVRGVASSEVGYANGRSQNATYGDGSGYAEVVKIEYDPAQAPLPFLLDLYYDAIDPTSLNRQGNDRGTEYRTGIYYTDAEDRAVIDQSLAALQKRYSKPIAIEVGPLTTYSRAEEYHQGYLDKHPDGYCHIPKKLFEAAAAAQPK